MADSKYAVKRLIAGHETFSKLRREYSVTLPPADASKLLDGHLQLWLAPTMTPASPGELLGGADNVRVWFNEFDVTDSLVSLLQASMSQLPPAMLAADYLRGVDQVLAVAQLAGPAIGLDVVASRKTAQTIASSGVASALNRLGDRTVGWSGIVHPALFLFRYIKTPPLSVEQIWLEDQQRRGVQPRTIASLNLHQLSFTQAASTSGTPPTVQGDARGEIHFSLELAHENPLRPILEDFAARLKGIDMQLEELRVSYLGPTSDKIHQLATETRASLTGLESTLQDVEQTVRQIRP